MSSILDAGGTFGSVRDSHDEMSGTLTDRLPSTLSAAASWAWFTLIPRPVLFPEGAQAARQNLARILIAHRNPFWLQLKFSEAERTTVTYSFANFPQRRVDLLTWPR